MNTKLFFRLPLFLVLGINHAFAQAPTLSYPATLSLTAGNTMTAVTPATSGVAAPGFSSTASAIIGGLKNPLGVTVDAAGNIYVADSGNNLVKEFPVGGGTPIIIGSGFQSPADVKVDATGNVFVVDTRHGAIKEVMAGTGIIKTIGSGFNNPTAIAIDAAGNVYVADNGYSSGDFYSGIVRISAVDGSFSSVASGSDTDNTIISVAIDATGGDIFYVDPQLYHLFEQTPAGSIAYYSAGTNPGMISVDATGNVYMAYNQIQVLPAGSAASFTLSNSFVSPYGIATDAANNLYIGDKNTDSIYKIKPTGGYFISPGLPIGLNFNNTTGVISGKPLVASPLTTYTITAYNASGSKSTTLNLKVLLPALPSLSYAGPQTYTAFTDITPLSPATARVTAVGFSTFPASVGSGFSKPGGTAVDAAGNVYVADAGLNEVLKIPAGGGAPVPVGSGFNAPVALAFDAAGNLYIADQGNNAIKEIKAGTNSPIFVGSGFNHPNGVTVDALGNVFVSDLGNNQIKEVVGGQGPPVVIVADSQPAGVAIDNQENLYIISIGNTYIREIPLTSGGFAINRVGGLVQPVAITIDPTGNIYVADSGTNTIQEILFGKQTQVAIRGNFLTPSGVAVDGSGNIFVGDQGNRQVKQIKPIGGYFMDKPLPPGLILSNSTGVISGGASTSSPAQNYTITGYNTAGGAKAAVNIAVTPVPSTLLSALTISSGTLSPTFQSNTYSYTVSVPETVSSITLTPTDTASNSIILINNAVRVTSGTASKPIALASGANTIRVEAYDQDGYRNQVYTIIVYRISNVATLSALAISKGTLTPAFATATTSYTDMETNGTTSVTLTPTVTDVNATIVVNGTQVRSGVATSPILLAVGANPINVVVTAQDGVTTKTYTVNVIRPSMNAKLAGLTVSYGSLLPVFNTDTTTYSDYAPYAVSSLTLTPTVAVAGATVTVNGVTVASGSASAPVALAVGVNVIKIVVTAQDGLTTKTYTLNVERPAGSTNANLSALAVSKGTLSPAFNASTVAYSDMVTNGTSSVTVTPTLSNVNATITVNGTAVASGSASGPVSLVVGSNVITILVTAQNGTSTKTYKVTVVRPSTNAKLAALKISSGTLAPAFNTNTTSYTASVTNATATITVTPTIATAGATIKVNGTAATSGSPSAAIALSVGANKVGIIVTAQDGTTTDTYTVTVTRAASSENIPDAETSVQTPTNKPLFDEDLLIVHQGISPNGDGVNDFLLIDNISNYPDNKLSVMNRDGQLVYEAKGYDNATKVFDGHSNKNGQMQLPGTYFYSLDYTVKGIVKHKTGFLVLKY